MSEHRSSQSDEFGNDSQDEEDEQEQDDEADEDADAYDENEEYDDFQAEEDDAEPTFNVRYSRSPRFAAGRPALGR